MKEELRVIPKKNYIILGIVILVSLLIIYYFYKIFKFEVVKKKQRTRR